MSKKLVITEDVKHLILHSIPDALVSPTGNRFLTLLQDIVDELNSLNAEEQQEETTTTLSL